MLASSKLATTCTIFALIARAANIDAETKEMRCLSGVMGSDFDSLLKYLLNKRCIFRMEAL
jgi:hypothetical protein